MYHAHTTPVDPTAIVCAECGAGVDDCECTVICRTCGGTVGREDAGRYDGDIVICAWCAREGCASGHGRGVRL